LMDKEGIVPQEESNRKNNSNSDKSKYLRVVPGDIAYNTMRMWEGRSALVGMEGLVSPAYTVCEPKPGVHSLLFSYYLKSPQLIGQFRRFSQGIVKDTLNLKYPAFAQISALIPSYAEQQRIADCLSSLDDLIAAQAQKVDELKTHKKGLMQQLFPREGESQPRLRFPEFQDAGEWDVRRLDQMVCFQSGGTPSKANPDFWKGSIPWVSAKDMKQILLSDAEDHISTKAIDQGAKLVPSGTLLMLVRGMTLLKNVPICVICCKMSFNQDVKALRPLNGVDSLFLALVLTSSKNRLLEMVSIAGHGTGKLDTEGLKAMALALPSTEEQQRIASCLSNLDALITAETQKHETLKTHKKGLMQQLFPSAEETLP
jgi:type I restriction enzyme, S subunit